MVAPNCAVILTLHLREDHGLEAGNHEKSRLLKEIHIDAHHEGHFMNGKEHPLHTRNFGSLWASRG